MTIRPFLSIVKRFRFLTLLIFMACAPQLAWETYVDKSSKIKVSHPANWTKESSFGATIFKSPKEGDKDPFQENINVMVQDMTAQPLTLDEYTELTKKQIKEYPGVILSLRKTTFSKHEAMEIVYSLRMQGNDLKFKQYWFIKNKKAYLFTFTALNSEFDKYKSISDKAAQSFGLVD